MVLSQLVVIIAMCFTVTLSFNNFFTNSNLQSQGPPRVYYSARMHKKETRGKCNVCTEHDQQVYFVFLLMLAVVESFDIYIAMLYELRSISLSLPPDSHYHSLPPSTHTQAVASMQWWWYQLQPTFDSSAVKKKFSG